jgi:Lysylphosphatidylglycerol synthase TM region
MRRLVMAAVVLGAGLLLVHTFWGLNLASTGRALVRMGAAAPLALVPFFGGMLFDTLGVCALLRVLGHRATIREVLPIRIATEALHLTAPAGFLVADSTAAALLEARCTVPLADGGVVALARRWLVMRAHFAYVALGAAVGFAALAGASARGFGGSWLPWAVAASSLAPLALSAGVGAGFGRRASLSSLLAATARWAWLRPIATRWGRGASSVDERLARVGRAHGALWSATSAFFACWLLESLDTAVVLRLLGSPSDFALAMGAEVGISLLRSIGNVAPASLGVQDAGYATLLPAMGIGVDVAAALVVVKRAKELAWIVCGYALLGSLRRRAVATAGTATVDGGLAAPV